MGHNQSSSAGAPRATPASKTPTSFVAWAEEPTSLGLKAGRRRSMKILRSRGGRQRHAFDDVDSRRGVYLRHSHVVSASGWSDVNNMHQGVLSPW